jgi:CRP-like cAMP-binding protein
MPAHTCSSEWTAQPHDSHSEPPQPPKEDPDAVLGGREQGRPELNSNPIPRRHHVRRSGIRPGDDDARRKLDVAEVRSVLLKLPWLRGCSAGHLRILSEAVRQIVAPKFAAIYHEGSYGDRLFILVRGAVGITGIDQRHSRTVLPVDSFGEASLVTPGGREATAIALKASLLLSIGHNDLFDQTKGPSDFAAVVLARLLRAAKGKDSQGRLSPIPDIVGMVFLERKAQESRIESSERHLSTQRMSSPPTEDKDTQMIETKAQSGVPARARRLQYLDRRGSRLEDYIARAEENEETGTTTECDEKAQGRATSTHFIRVRSHDYLVGGRKTNNEPVGRVTGRLGPTPSHLRGVRPREQRLTQYVVADALHVADHLYERVNRIIADIDARHGGGVVRQEGSLIQNRGPS